MGSVNQANEEIAPLWTPLQDGAPSKMEALMAALNKKYPQAAIRDYKTLHRWSCDNFREFWSFFVNDRHHNLPLEGDTSVVLEDEAGDVPMSSIPRWFPRTKMNFVECLASVGWKNDERVAIVSYGEESISAAKGAGEAEPTRITFAQLYTRIAIVQRILSRRFGVKENDCVAAYCGNWIDCITLCLAAASLGAQFTTISPDFGAKAARARLLQTRPKLLIAQQSIIYNGKCWDHMGKVKDVVGGIASIQAIIMIEQSITTTAGKTNIDSSGLGFEDTLPVHSLNYLIEDYCRDNPGDKMEIEFPRFAFDHPLYILYSSGSTGVPKCIVHGAGGTLIQHFKEHELHGNCSESDTYLQYTNIGWMMWHWQLSVLGLGARIVLWDGSPFAPSAPDALLQVVEREGVSIFGVGAKYLQCLQEKEEEGLGKKRLFGNLRLLYSTASPLSAETMEWISKNLLCRVQGDDQNASHSRPRTRAIQIASITGGTDIIGLFGGGNPIECVWPGQIQCWCLGMDVRVVGEDGVEVEDGHSGDLTCVKPFPSMPVAFLGDDLNKSIYKRSYFTPQTTGSGNEKEQACSPYWRHGDFCRKDKQTGGIVMLGRSDGTLNPNGVRFGSSEIYACLEGIDWIEDSMVVGVMHASNENVFLFIKVRENHDKSTSTNTTLSPAQTEAIKKAIRTKASPKHVPSTIIKAPIIPYTNNGKKVEVIVKRILGGVDENAFGVEKESLQFYFQLAHELRNEEGSMATANK